MAGKFAGPRFFPALACFLLYLRFINSYKDDFIPETKEPCSRSCVSESCYGIGIRYGKFCGVGWTGCAGEKPCDDLDACCLVHDECVGREGMTNVKCHQRFKKCMKKVMKSGKVGFSETCPYAVAIPTMTQGMDMAILLSQFGGLSDLE